MPEFARPAAWTGRTLPALRRALLAWFDRARRDLPWRRDRDPYRIWVSEIMLQQTTVAAVVPYFERFLAAFPTLESLAAADEERVLRLWEGLGYYRRARYLHAAARTLVADHGGTFPDDPAVWQALPGVGRYVAGAVLSQAFDRKLPIVEANSLRVLARWFGHRGDPRAGAGKKWVWTAAAAVLPATRVGDFNQALMELGALVCTPAAPRCPECPVANYCEARRIGLQESIPPRPRAKAVTAVREVAVVIRDRGRVLLARRPPDADRWQNLWELPHGEVATGEAPGAAAVRIARVLTGLAVRPGPEVATVRHGVTRWSITLTGIEARRLNGRFRSHFFTAAKWLRPAELAAYPMSTPQRRLLRELVR